MATPSIKPKSLEPRAGTFKVVSDFQPSGDQPTAIDDLARRIDRGERDVVLLGATGTGKSATTAWLVEKVQRQERILYDVLGRSHVVDQEHREPHQLTVKAQEELGHAGVAVGR